MAWFGIIFLRGVNIIDNKLKKSYILVDDIFQKVTLIYTLFQPIRHKVSFSCKCTIY